MGGNLFLSSPNLSEVHIRATVPPTLHVSTFSGIPDGMKIYVPYGYKETYVTSSNEWAKLENRIFEEAIQ